MSDSPISHHNLPCANCGAAPVGHYCPNCGQSAKVYEKPVCSFLKEFLGDLFAFDSRFWRSLPALIVRPGTMISEYISGKHGSYMPPFRIYVFVSFFFFLLLEFFTTANLEKNAKSFSNPSVADSIVQSLTQIDSVSHFQAAKDSSTAHDATNRTVNLQIDGQDSATTKARLKEILEDPAKYISKFYKNLSWSFFLLLPLLGFFFWLFFRKARAFYVPHFLFAIQLHTMLFFVLALILAIDLLWPSAANFVQGSPLWLLPAHAVLGARQLYGLGWMSTFFRLATATVLYIFCIILATTLTVIYIFTS